MGHMVEDMENKMRSTLNEIYFGKTKDIVNDLRSSSSKSDQDAMKAVQSSLADALKKRASKHWIRVLKHELLQLCTYKLWFIKTTEESLLFFKMGNLW